MVLCVLCREEVETGEVVHWACMVCPVCRSRHVACWCTEEETARARCSSCGHEWEGAHDGV